MVLAPLHIGLTTTPLWGLGRACGCVGWWGSGLGTSSRGLFLLGRAIDSGVSHSVGSDHGERVKMIAGAIIIVKHGIKEVEVRPKPTMLVDEALKLKGDSLGLDSSLPGSYKGVVLHLKAALQAVGSESKQQGKEQPEPAKGCAVTLFIIFLHEDYFLECEGDSQTLLPLNFFKKMQN